MGDRADGWAARRPGIRRWCAPAAIPGEPPIALIRRLPAFLFAALLALGPAGAGRVLAATTAVDDSFEVDEDAELTVSDVGGLLANDLSDGGALCVVGFAATDSLIGQLGGTDATDGSFTYTPPLHYFGSTTFDYAIAEYPSGECPVEVHSTARVTITINPVNDAPSARADSFIVLAGRTLNVAAPGVLQNDGDVEEDTLTAVKGQSPAHGVLTLAADGSFSYTPTAGFSGQDGFSYTAFDGQASSPTRVVTLQVTPIPPSPTPIPPPTAAPTPTPVPATPTPEPSAVPSPSPTPSIEPSVAPIASPSPVASIAPLPSATAEPDPASDEEGVSTPVLIVVVLLLILLAFGAAFFVPRWLRAKQTGADMDDLA